MKALMMIAMTAAAVLIAPVAHADADMAKAKCGNCHDMDKKKKGPSYKAIASKYKGKEAEAFKAVTDPDGDHPEVKAKPDEIKAVLKWVLQQ